MQSKTPATLAELELVHKNASAVLEECLKVHGGSYEMRTMQSAISHIEEKIDELRAALQEGHAGNKQRSCRPE